MQNEETPYGKFYSAIVGKIEGPLAVLIGIILLTNDINFPNNLDFYFGLLALFIGLIIIYLAYFRYRKIKRPM